MIMLNTKEELYELLKKYQGILAKPMIEYLTSLIEQEFSVVQEKYISKQDREVLSELEIYKKVAIYNIFWRANHFFMEHEMNFKLKEQDRKENCFRAYIQLNSHRVKIFEFDYRNQMKLNHTIPTGYKTMNIGTISFYQTLENQELREKELEMVMSKLEGLYDQHNPYYNIPSRFGGPAPQWAYEHACEIEKYEEKFTILDSKKELTDDEKREIEITNQIYHAFLDDYGLTNDSFIEDDYPNNFLDFDHEKTNLEKTLVKQIPNLKIVNHVKYL